MNAQIKSRIIATLATTLLGFIGNQILGLMFASFPANWPIGTGLILANIGIGAIALKALQKTTPLWAALVANIFAFFVMNHLFDSGNFVPSSRSLAVYLLAIVVSYWTAQFAALSAIEFVAPRMAMTKHSS
jgi:hypothetical protein